MKIICFGDSLTSCGGENGRFSDILRDRFSNHNFVNAGVGGQTIVEGRSRLADDVLAERPDIVMVEYGANDWWRDERPPEAWAADLEVIVEQIRHAGAQAVILGVFGTYIDDAGQRCEKEFGTDPRAIHYRGLESAVASRHGCPYIPNIQERIIGRRCCWRDRNHPNELGNRHVADCIEPVLAKLLGEPPCPVRKPDLRTTRDFWREAVSLAGDRLAVVDGEQRLSYAQADERIMRIAAGLRRLTGTSRPTVAVTLPNCVEYYLLYWAVVHLGGVIVPLNPWLKADALGGVFANVRPDALVVPSAKASGVLEAARGADVRACIALAPGGDRLTSWEEMMDCREEIPLGPLDEDALSIIMHTSGTTGVPKGAMMRHRDLMFNVMTTLNAHKFSGKDVHLLVNPMFHCTALYSSLPSAAYTKTPVIIASPHNERHLMELVEREGITTFLSVPSVFQQLLNVQELGRFDASSLRLLAYAGSPMPIHTIRGLRDAFPDAALHNFFGLTETISMTHVMNADEAENRLDSIGRLLPFVEARVVDEKGTPVPGDEVGELLFARENVIPGYYNQPERLEEAFTESEGRTWFRTGDLACVDQEGYFFIRGRKKDMIIVGGENVYAAEVEGVLLSHPQVQEAAVKGVPATGVAAFLGEEVKAFIVKADPALEEANLKRHCFERLPGFKMPRSFVFMDALPRNPSGKVVKKDLT